MKKQNKVGELSELILQSGKKEVVVVSNMPSEAVEQAVNIAQEMTFENTNAILNFAVEPQQTMNTQLDILLEGVTIRETGIAGDLTVELAKGIDMMKLNKMSKQMSKKWTFSKLPLIGQFFSWFRLFYLRRKKVIDMIRLVEVKAKQRQIKLKTTNEKSDELLRSTINNISSLAIWIHAGNLILQRAGKEFTDLKQQVTASGDMNMAVKLKDFHGQITAFDVRLLRLKTAYTEALLAAPQVRLIQESTKIEMQNILDSILVDMPRLKRAIINLAAVFNIRAAQEEGRARSDASHKLAVAAADQLNIAYTEAKKSQGRGLEEVKKVEEVAKKLIATLKTGQKIDAENVKKRQQAEIKLIEVKESVQKSLLDVVAS